MELALYKGPPSNVFHKASHYGIRVRTWSKYSHAELVINGVCYSSSARDKGVRGKDINLNSGHWDVFKLTDDPVVTKFALDWFTVHDGDLYDYRNFVRYMLPFVGEDKNKWVCFESIGAALGIDKPHKLTADTLLAAALKIKGDPQLMLLRV